MSLDLGALTRRLKPEKHWRQLRPRPLEALHAANVVAGGRAALVPDTNVYIRAASGSLPAPVVALLDRSLQFHCSVCLGELAVGVGAYSPAAAGWAAVRDHYDELFAAVPVQRVLIPDFEIWTAAGLVAGILARIQGVERSGRGACLNDALILLAAAKAGLPVLTADRVDYDLIQQIAGVGAFLYF